MESTSTILDLRVSNWEMEIIYIYIIQFSNVGVVSHGNTMKYYLI